MKILRWFKAIWRRVFPKSDLEELLAREEKRFLQYTPKTEAEKLKPEYPVKTFPERKEAPSLSMMIRIIRARRDWCLKSHSNPKWLLLSSDQHKELIRDIEKKFSSPWTKPEDFKEFVGSLSKRFFGMDIICAAVNTLPSFDLATCKKEGVLEL